MRNGKVWKRIGVIAAAAFAAGAILINSQAKKETTLELAVFNGSNWDVAVQDSFEIVEDAIASFEESHPGVHVVCTSGIPEADYSEWLSRKILENDAPDVMVLLSQDVDRFVKLGVLENLDPYISGANGLDTEVFFGTALTPGYLEHHQYCLPVETMPKLMFVNKTLLSKEMVQVPASGYTFQNLYDICRRITKDTDGDGVVDQFGIYKYNWLDAAASAGAELFSADGSTCNFTSPEMKEAIQLMQKLTALNEGQTVTQENFDNGQVAFMPLSLAEYRTYKSYPYKIKAYSNFKWDCIEMPRGGNGDNISRVDTLLAGVGSRSGNKKEAWELLRYLTSEEELQTELFRSMPTASVLRDVMRSDEAAEILKGEESETTSLKAELVADVIENGRSEPIFEAYNGAIALADAELTQVYSSRNVDLDTELRSVQAKVKNYLASVS